MIGYVPIGIASKLLVLTTHGRPLHNPELQNSIARERRKTTVVVIVHRHSSIFAAPYVAKEYIIPKLLLQRFVYFALYYC
jgi:hypothetical protein